jgi:glutaconyl-CoA/methylmalonyl-CoA decarboxylase subunit gamma
MKKFKFTINGNQYEADILGIDDNIAEVDINGTVYKVEVDRSIPVTKTPKLVRMVAVPSTDSHPSVSKTASPSAPKGSGNIKSPLPGVILTLHVKEGEIVKIGQKLISLEAMKMENNINADKEGKVISIKVKQGDQVMEGDVLIVIGD